ncbi:hypothetical protein GQ44DRAFT_777673 [Phaeosphaeriaceae sp. PMI808]|nr:hypothetical protein GQ44DRAFT_777673 [Phaeosphaeriaceae sp. PMI808]
MTDRNLAIALNSIPTQGPRPYRDFLADVHEAFDANAPGRIANTEEQRLVLSTIRTMIKIASRANVHRSSAPVAPISNIGPPRTVNDSFYHHHSDPSFATLHPNVDLATYGTPRDEGSQLEENREPATTVKKEVTEPSQGDSTYGTQLTQQNEASDEEIPRADSATMKPRKKLMPVSKAAYTSPRSSSEPARSFLDKYGRKSDATVNNSTNDTQPTVKTEGGDKEVPRAEPAAPKPCQKSAPVFNAVRAPYAPTHSSPLSSPPELASSSLGKHGRKSDDAASVPEIKRKKSSDS